MKYKIQNIAMHIFSWLCVFTTLVIGAYWCYRYSLNEDLSVVTYTPFDERKGDIHPTVSMCLRNPFLKYRLSEYGVNETSYLGFLHGEHFSKELLKVDFNNVTIDILDYIKGYRIYFRNGSITKLDSGLTIEEKRTLTTTSFIGFSQAYFYLYKCFALTIPKVDDLHIFRILLSNKIFPNSIRPTVSGLLTFVHLPQQYLLALHTMKWIWQPRTRNESYKMRFLINEVTVERKRNKPEKTCNEHWMDYDDWVMKHHQNKSSCNNPYLHPNQDLPMCNNQHLMRRALFQNYIVTTDKYEVPCKTMEEVRIEHVESNIETREGETEGEFWLSIGFQNDRFKEIRQAR